MQPRDDNSKPGDGSGSPSLLARLLGRTTQIDRKEMPAVIASFLLIFCVMCGYFAVRSVRETAGTFLGKERVANLFLITWIASLAIVPAYGWVVARFRRAAYAPARVADHRSERPPDQCGPGGGSGTTGAATARLDGGAG